MKYPMLAGRLFNQPLLVRAEYARTVAEVLKDRMQLNVDVPGTQSFEEVEPYAPSLDKKGILTVPILGGLYSRGDGIDADSGFQSYTNLHSVLARAMDDKQVKGVLLDIDSPGGECGGCFSFADTITAMNKKKPIWAVANSGAASAAYALGAAAGKFYAARDAEVGSIGVVMLHFDMSKMMEERGMVATYVYAGAHKIDGNPFEPLTPEARAEFSKRIGQSYDLFVELVSDRRSLTADDVRATEARLYIAAEAEELGLIDGVMSLEEARDRLRSEVSTVRHVRVNHVTEQGKVIHND